MKRTKAHEKALAVIRDLKARLKRVQEDYDALRWTHDPVFGYDPNKSLSTGYGALKREYGDGVTADWRAVARDLKKAYADVSDLRPGRTP